MDEITRPYHVRWMIRRDMDIVLEIERRCFMYPWKKDDFIRCLRQRNCIGMSVEDHSDGGPKDVIGFMIYELHKSRIHILNIAVHPEFAGLGAGFTMMRKLKSKLSHQRRNRLLCEIRSANLPAQKWFQRQGWKAVGVLHDFYGCTDEDAYLFEYCAKVKATSKTNDGQA